MALQIDSISGWCPVQAEGTVDGVPFYFRARHTEWQMAIGNDPVGITCGEPGWMREGEWGEGPHDAGYMPVEVARELIDQCVDEWRQSEITYGPQQVCVRTGAYTTVFASEDAEPAANQIAILHGNLIKRDAEIERLNERVARAEAEVEHWKTTAASLQDIMDGNMRPINEVARRWANHE